MKKILAEVVATHKNIVWEELMKANRGFYSSTGALTPSSVDFYTEMIQVEMLKKMTKQKDQMQSLIDNLENSLKKGNS